MKLYVYWNDAGSLRLRHPGQIMAGQGLTVDDSTSYRWAVKMLALLEKS